MKKLTKYCFLIFIIKIQALCFVYGKNENKFVILSPQTDIEYNITNKGLLYVDSFEVINSTGIESLLKVDIPFRTLNKNVLKYRNTYSGVLKYYLQSNHLDNHNYILEFTNSEVDYIQIVLVCQDSLIWKSNLTGDFKNFDTRPIQHRFFAFPLKLKPNKKYELYIVFNKKNRTLTSTILIHHENNWNRKVQSDSLFHGIFQGLFISFILIGLIMFLFLKQKIFLYYALYALMVFLLLFTINGYSFQYIYPNTPQIQQQSTIIIQILGLIFLNLYAFNFVQFSVYFKKIDYLKICWLTLYSIFILLALVSIWHPMDMQKSLAIILYVFEFLNFSFLLVFPLITYIKHKKREALVFFLSYLFVGITLFYTILSFLIKELPYVPLLNTMNIALFIEMFSLLLYMVFNYRSILQQKIVAENKLYESQRHNQEAFIEGQEKEKREIALNIHDNISSNLFALKNKINQISTFETDAISKEIDIISKELRDISHELLPATLEDLGLESALNGLLQNFSTFYTVHLHCQDLPKSISKNMSIHIYRIFQELLKNAAKHASAKNVYVQLFGETNSLEIQYEDDGVGFSKSSKNIGIGFKSINYRVNLLNGNISVESEVNKGLLINISIPC